MMRRQIADVIQAKRNILSLETQDRFCNDKFVSCYSFIDNLLFPLQKKLKRRIIVNHYTVPVYKTEAELLSIFLTDQ